MKKDYDRVPYFKTRCLRCFRRVEIPLLSDFLYGTLLYQTADGQDFYIAEFVNNKTFDFVENELERNTHLKNVDPQVILLLLADRPNAKNYSPHFPICPKCRKRLILYNDNESNKTEFREIGYATWSNFEALSDTEKVEKIKQVAMVK